MKDCYNDYYPFIYLDDILIDDLYPQIFGDVIERSVTHSSEDHLDASINSSLLNVLGSNVSSNQNSTVSENVRFVASTSRKAQLLINHFRSDRTDILSLQNIIFNNQPFKQNICFVGKATFFLSDIYSEKIEGSLFSSAPEDIMQCIIPDSDSVLVLETGNTGFIKDHCTYNENDDDYYLTDIPRRSNDSVIMHMSNSKIKTNLRRLTGEIRRMTHFDFFVFGQLIRHGDQFYRIRPFAIWM